MKLFLTDFLITPSFIQLRVFGFGYKANTKTRSRKISELVMQTFRSLFYKSEFLDLGTEQKNFLKNVRENVRASLQVPRRFMSPSFRTGHPGRTGSIRNTEHWVNLQYEK